MDRQRAAMLVVVAAVLAILFVSGRHTGITSGVAARAVSREPAGWVGISGDVRFPGIYPLTANVVTHSDIFLTEPDCAPPPLQFIAQAAAGNRLQFFCSPGGGSAVVELLPLNTVEHLLLDIPIDLNRVTAADLEKIPGIGPVLAERIIRYRQNNGGFVRVTELPMVEGVGSATYHRLSRYFK